MPVLAIDQGTTSTRALRVDADGRSEITCSVKHRQYYPAPGRVEHDPEELIASLESCIDSAPDADAIGIDNQGESCLAWHADTGRAISPVIVWQDNRTEPLIEQLKREGREAQVLHTFFEMADGSCLAFFEEPGEPFEFKDQRDFDLHIALEVSRETLLEMFEKGKAAGIETRGISDHGFIDSIYFRDPNGYLIELAAAKEDAAGERPDAHQILAEWQAAKAAGG